MKFEEVLPLLREGKKFRRPHWFGDDLFSDKYIYAKNDTLILVYVGDGDECSEDEYHRLSGEDIFADDWEMVE